MSQPKFSVGEEVILQSQNYSQYNGNYVVEEVIAPSQDYICRLTGRLLTNFSLEYNYKLSRIFNVGHALGCEAIPRERRLRKKHKPSEFKDFTSLMNNLKLPQKSVA